MTARARGVLLTVAALLPFVTGQHKPESTQQRVLQQDTNGGEQGCQSMREIMEMAPDLGSFRALVPDDVLMGEFSNPDAEITVFAPTDAALSAISADHLQELSERPDALNAILNYHIVDGSVDSTTLATTSEIMSRSGVLVVESTDGSIILIAPNGGTDATVVEADLFSCRGVLHKIDDLLVPVLEVSDVAAMPVPSPVQGSGCGMIGQPICSGSQMIGRRNDCDLGAHGVDGMCVKYEETIDYGEDDDHADSDSDFPPTNINTTYVTSITTDSCGMGGQPVCSGDQMIGREYECDYGYEGKDGICVDYEPKGDDEPLADAPSESEQACGMGGQPVCSDDQMIGRENECDFGYEGENGFCVEYKEKDDTETEISSYCQDTHVSNMVSWTNEFREEYDSYLSPLQCSEQASKVAFEWSQEMCRLGSLSQSNEDANIEAAGLSPGADESRIYILMSHADFAYATSEAIKVWGYTRSQQRKMASDYNTIGCGWAYCPDDHPDRNRNRMFWTCYYGNTVDGGSSFPVETHNEEPSEPEDDPDMTVSRDAPPPSGSDGGFVTMSDDSQGDGDEDDPDMADAPADAPMIVFVEETTEADMPDQDMPDEDMPDQDMPDEDMPDEDMPQPAPAGGGGSCGDALVQEMISGNNAYREENGLSSLECNENGCQAAYEWSQQMCSDGELSHDGFDQNVAAAGFNSAAAENVLFNTQGVDRTASTGSMQWQMSTGHSRNILGDYEQISCGWFECDGGSSNNRIYWTCLYGTP